VNHRHIGCGTPWAIARESLIDGNRLQRGPKTRGNQWDVLVSIVAVIETCVALPVRGYVSASVTGLQGSLSGFQG
jgi:hypothetical protein